MYQCFAEEYGTGGGFVIPGILRAPLNLTFVPALYPMLPPRTHILADVGDPLWDHISPSHRLTGTLLFCSSPIGMVSGHRSHTVEPIFADELGRDRCVQTQEDGDGVVSDEEEAV